MARQTLPRRCPADRQSSSGPRQTTPHRPQVHARHLLPSSGHSCVRRTSWRRMIAAVAIAISASYREAP
jgi:hypothetical protein